MALSRTPVLCAPIKSRTPSTAYCSLKGKIIRFSVPKLLSNFALHALVLLLFCGSVDGERRVRLNAAIGEKKTKLVRLEILFRVLPATN